MGFMRVWFNWFIKMIGEDVVRVKLDVYYEIKIILIRVNIK